MSEPSLRFRRAAASSLAVFLLASCAVHLGVFLFGGYASSLEVDTPLRFELPAEVTFGLSEDDSGGQPAPEPAPAQEVPKPALTPPRARAPRVEATGMVAAVDAGVPPVDEGSLAQGPSDAAVLAEVEGEQDGEPSEASGLGLFPGADGEGGTGLGGEGGDGMGRRGATIALNVDLDRVRKSALLLEAAALLDVIPEWQFLLAGSGLDPVTDLERVFVATPNLARSSLVMSARVRGRRSKIEGAVQALAAERGKPAAFSSEAGVLVAPWWNRGPTRRVLALQGQAEQRFLITRAADLKRVLSVARALQRTRVREGFSRDEVQLEGGLLAMRGEEAVALWVEGVRHYVKGDAPNVPRSMRMSIKRIDEYYTELRASGRYDSSDQAQAALDFADGLRKRLSTHPRVIFLGLKSALDKASITREHDTLAMSVQLTLHQTRYLMSYVSKALTLRE